MKFKHFLDILIVVLLGLALQNCSSKDDNQSAAATPNTNVTTNQNMQGYPEASQLFGKLWTFTSGSCGSQLLFFPSCSATLEISSNGIAGVLKATGPFPAPVGQCTASSDLALSYPAPNQIKINFTNLRCSPMCAFKCQSYSLPPPVTYTFTASEPNLTFQTNDGGRVGCHNGIPMTVNFTRN